MPKLSDDEYAAQNATVLELAKKDGGTTINEIMDKVGCSRPRATDLVSSLNLAVVDTKGRTRFFGPPGSTPAPVSEKKEPKAGEKKATQKKEKSQADILEAKARRAASTMVSALLAIMRSERDGTATEGDGEVSPDVVEVEPNAETPAATESTPAPAAEVEGSPATAETPAAEPAAAN